MIETILNALAQKINEGCLFLSKPCGVARYQQERVDKKIKIYPVIANTNPDTCNKQPLIAMVPGTNETAYCYFDVLNSQIMQPKSQTVDVTAYVRLVGWINTKRFENYEQGSIERSLMKCLNEKGLTVPNGLNIKAIEIVSVEPKTAAIFKPATFDEVETQYLMPPFDCFSIKIKISYRDVFACAETPILSLKENC
jgi:hypothetical protein